MSSPTTTTDAEDLPDTPEEVFKLLPRAARIAVYSVYALIGLALTATTVGIAAVGGTFPDWLTVTLAVYPVIGTGVGFTAVSNINSPHKGA